MPPRASKRGGGTPTARKSGGKAAKSAQKQPVPDPEPVAVEEKLVEEVPEISPAENDPMENESSVLHEVEVKETYDDLDKGERLELEDNEPESEPEEDVGVYYGEKELEHEDDDPEENAEEVDEEGGDVSEEEGDMVEEEIEEEGEEIEGQDVDEGDHEDQVDLDEHHEVVKERRKRKEFEVFVGGLDKDATEEDLRKVFSAVGEVTEVRLMMNPVTKKNKGFAFLRFATVEQATRACEELKNPVVHGKQCGVSPSQDSDTLFLGNICKTWTKEALKEKLKSFGIENMDDITLVDDSNHEGMNRGFAFLEFASRSDAMDAYKRLQKRDVVFGIDRTAKVAFADSFVEPDDEIMAQVKTVFVDGLPATWDEDRVKGHLKKYGAIEKIELARNMPAAKRKDFGFITFDAHDAAVACAEGINNIELGEGDNKVKVRARLSRPHQKGRGVRRAVRGDYRLGRGGIRGGRAPWGRSLRPEPRRFPIRVSRGVSSRGPPFISRGLRRPTPFRDRRPVPPPVPVRVRHVPLPEKLYDRRVPAYPRSSSKREYSRRDDDLPPPRARPVAEFGSRLPAERRPSYRDEYPSRGSEYPSRGSEYPSRGSGYSDTALRTASRAPPRRVYEDEAYVRRVERPPTYHDERSRDYDSVSGAKRPYSSMKDVSPRYAEANVRHSRARLEYGVSAGASSYSDASYGESSRLARSSHMYGGSGRSSISGHNTHNLYESRSMGYGGPISDNEIGGLYSSRYDSDYLPSRADVGSSYSSMYSSRGLGGGGYIGSSGSGSYY